MKLSSISLTIAAALAAIAGSVIAAPIPVHERALEQVDIFRRGTFPHLVAAEAHGRAADALQLAVEAHQNAAIHTTGREQRASRTQVGYFSWLRQSHITAAHDAKHNMKINSDLLNQVDDHITAAEEAVRVANGRRDEATRIASNSGHTSHR